MSIGGEAHRSSMPCIAHGIPHDVAEGTCVGTGMGFEAAFYYYRPASPLAPHGYGPVLLAGAEMIRLLKIHRFEINDGAA